MEFHVARAFRLGEVGLEREALMHERVRRRTGGPVISRHQRQVVLALLRRLEPVQSEEVVKTISIHDDYVEADSV